MAAKASGGGASIEARALGIPVMLAFEGWGASGKGSQINRLLQALDPRGVSVHSIQPPSEENAKLHSASDF